MPHVATERKLGKSLKKYLACHAQSLAATNRVTEQLNWLTVESFFYVLFNSGAFTMGGLMD
jgi:hypothetical protein